MARAGRAASASATEPSYGTIELQRLPGTQTLANLFGELRRIGGCPECLGRQDRRGLVMLPSPSAFGAHRHDDIRPKRPDVPDEVSQDLLMAPLLERFLLAERVAEVHRAREVLLRAVEAMRDEQFLGAKHPQRIEELSSDLVLSAVAACGCDERHARTDVTRVERQHRIVLVVGMRRHVDDRADGRQLPQGQRQRRRAGQVGERLDAILRNGLLGADLPLQGDRRGCSHGQEPRHFHRISTGRGVRDSERYPARSAGFGQLNLGTAVRAVSSTFDASQPPEAFVTRFRIRASVAFVLVCTAGLVSPASARQPPAKAAPTQSSTQSNELDAFMEKVLKRREVNRQTLEQYVLDETEQFEVLGPTRMPVYRQKRDYRWYVRDGLHVRSPVRFDGVSVGDAERKEYEDAWARRERGRLERKNGKGKDAATDTPEPATTSDAQAGPEGATPVPTPRFVSEAYFMDFKFEPGNYYLAGREQLEGHQVLRIEYYPTRMFNDSEDDKNRNAKPDASRDGSARDQKLPAGPRAESRARPRAEPRARPRTQPRA